jgi:hypothetical protein
MKREFTLTVHSEKPPAYAGRRERQAPAPQLRLPETPYFHVVRSKASSGGAVQGPASKQSPSNVSAHGNFFIKKE